MHQNQRSLESGPEALHDLSRGAGPAGPSLPGAHPDPGSQPGPPGAVSCQAPLAGISRPRPSRGPQDPSREKDSRGPLCITVPQGGKCPSQSPTAEPAWPHRPCPPGSLQTSSLPHRPCPPGSLQTSSPPHRPCPPGSLQTSSLPHRPCPPSSLQTSSLPHRPCPPGSLQTSSLPHRPCPPGSLQTSSLPPPPPRRSSPSRAETKTPSPGASPDQSNDFRVYIVTWNVGSSVPPDDIRCLFGSAAVDGSMDMFIVGLQEVNSMINKRLKDALFTDQWSEVFMDTLAPCGYVLVVSQRMQGVLLLLFSKVVHLPFLRAVQTESTRTGLGGCWGNKGGVSARMTVFGHSVCFLNCHLPAHMDNLEQRMDDFQSILQQQHFDEAIGVLDHDVVFWFGDLNFRIDDYDIHVVKCAVDSHKLPLLWERDQLNMAKHTEAILEGFLEGPLNFPPTYKFDVGTNTYDTSGKKRKPAWTDRILWRLRCTGSAVPSHSAALRRGLTSWLGGVTKVTQHEYRSHMELRASDHKPVSAIFSLHFPFRVDVPQVSLQVEAEWSHVTDATVRFSVAASYQRSSWDWVALYKVGFKHHKDYVAYIWAKGEHVTQVSSGVVHQVMFPEEDLPADEGEYMVGYYSHNMTTVVGVAGPVQVRLPVPRPASPTDSSDLSSEDDSTLVLLSSTSRSPSPKAGGRRHHHHHHLHHHHAHHPHLPPRSSQRSHSPALPVLSSNPLPSLPGLSLSPRPRDAKKERLVSPETLPSPSLSPLSPRSPRSPLSPRSPGGPGSGVVTVPEALVAAILGEHPPAPAGSPAAGPKHTGKHTHSDTSA